MPSMPWAGGEVDTVEAWERSDEWQPVGRRGTEWTTQAAPGPSGVSCRVIGESGGEMCFG